MKVFQSRRIRGFTLIELLVVISIVAVLLTMLLPVLGQARNITLRLRCANVERGLLQGTNNYSADEKQWTIHGDCSPWYARLGETWYQGSACMYNPYCRLGPAYGQYPTLAGIGMLTYNYYIPETKGAVGCPQSDFRDVIPPAAVYGTITMSTGYNAAYALTYNEVSAGEAVYRYMARNMSGSSGLLTTYDVRGPQMKADTARKNPGWPRYIDPNNCYDSSPIISPDKMAFFSDHEQEREAYCDAIAYGTSPMPYWQRVHPEGFNVGYLDGHVALFEDPTRLKLFSFSAYLGSDPKNYGTPYSVFGFDRD